jgi:hypothetical protein
LRVGVGCGGNLKALRRYHTPLLVDVIALALSRLPWLSSRDPEFSAVSAAAGGLTP